MLTSLLNRHVLKSRLQGFLKETIRKETSVCGVLVNHHGMGVLIRGESRTGKSGCALELVLNGGRLISDDRVVLRKFPNGELIGRSPERTKGMIEIKDLGVVNLRNLFGESAVGENHPIHRVVELSPSGESSGTGRVSACRILGDRLPLYRLASGWPLQAAEFIRHLASEFREKDPQAAPKKGRT